MLTDALTDALSSMLSRAAKFAAAAALGWLIVGWWLLSRYEDRGEWYADYASYDAILLGLGVSAVALFLALVPLLDRSRRRPLAVLLPGIVVLGCCVQIAVCWFYPAPSLDGVRVAAAAGDFVRAQAEFDALDADDRASEGAAELHELLLAQGKRDGEQLARKQADQADDHRLAQAGDASLKVATTLVLHRAWTDPDKQALARRRLLERARFIAEDAWTDHDGPALARIAEDTRGLDDDFSQQCETRAALEIGRSCAADGRWECVRAMLTKLEDGRALDPAFTPIVDQLRGVLEAVERVPTP
ncbi:hypothetical protein [Enhygromyxa salina]|uniref:Uncharacterized protein n=1 Tax=Enhygromyxa salina TaxID=215803 RepID=A0A2S9YYR8_9BACT|nr:hypothetical protein [Enhygromyxa salina]PRQ10238.1 hypothetical protein ENSA7_00470 [Enhygromyxa salina]